MIFSIVFNVLKTFNDALYIEKLKIRLFTNRECKGGKRYCVYLLEY